MFADSKRPQNVFIPFSTGLEYDLFDNKTCVDHYFYNHDYKEAVSLFVDEIKERGGHAGLGWALTSD